MKCTDNIEILFEKNKPVIKGILCAAVIAFAYILIIAVLYFEGNTAVDKHERSRYNAAVSLEDTFAEELCVIESDIKMDGYIPDKSLTSIGLFHTNSQQVSCAKRLFRRIYPASTTKIMTAYVALKYGNLDDKVTVTKSALTFSDPEAMISGLKEGETVTLHDLLYGLLLVSGNDCGNAIAEHISGSQEAFADLMNQEALLLGATNTHFCNAHGLHDKDHYTTGYDLYLMFQACLKDQRFIDIISSESYTVDIESYTSELQSEEKIVRQLYWKPTNFYSLGLIQDPEGTTIIGGKTGTTNEAGCCVVLYGIDSDDEPFISVTMGASDRDILYENTTSLIQTGNILQ